jgi:NCAIR mutase (PurE)-related protein
MSAPGPPGEPIKLEGHEPVDGRIEGIAELDLERPERLGMGEAIWGEHKSPEQITAILKRLAQARQLALVTRVDAEKAAAVLALHAEAHSAQQMSDRQALHPSPRHHPEARCLTLGILPVPAAQQVAILSGGSSDLVVAQEAALALRCNGIGADLVVDVGVAGLQRLLGELERLRQERVLIACAGMEGALPTVLAGLLPQPVIGVPVSVGYGVSAGGMAALHGMLASCSPGLTVVNIDNGYGAAMAALRILRGAGAGDRR